MGTDGMSIADAMALAKDDNGCFGGGGSMIFFLFFLLAWGNGGLFGGNRDVATQAAVSTAEMQGQFNFASLERQNNETIAAVKDAQMATVGATKDLSYTNLNQIRDVEAMISAMQAQQNACCCNTLRAIDSVNFNASQNAAAITNAIHSEGEQTRALINANTMQDLRDQLSQARMENSQCAQNSYLINQLQPVARPAYITCSPYAATAMPGCGCQYT